MLRNFISVTGITQENQLPKKIRGELVEHSDIDYIFIPSSRPKVKTINHVAISVELINQRVIKAPTGTAIILDGIKKLKISYSPLGHSRRNVQLEISLPYNTFIELPEGIDKLENIDIYVADAFFELVESRKIYNYTFYMVDVEYSRITDQDVENLTETVEEAEYEDNNSADTVDMYETDDRDDADERDDTDETNESFDDTLKALSEALLLYNAKKEDEESNIE